jgi:hypothetical protein
MSDTYLDYDVTVIPHEAKTLNELRIMVSAIPFTPSEGDLKIGKIPTRDAHITCRKADGEKWRVDVFQFADAWGKIFLYKADPFEPILLTQRGEEKKYATLDPIVNDFYRVIDGNGTVHLTIAHTTQEQDAIKEYVVDE